LESSYQKVGIDPLKKPPSYTHLLEEKLYTIVPLTE